MQIFHCPQCSNTLFFENTSCESCHSDVGYLAQYNAFFTLAPSSNTPKKQPPVKYCTNHQHGTCNWLVCEDSESEYCEACELNRYIPNLASIERQQEWRELELAKHRLVYSLLKLQLPFINKNDNKKQGLAFDFISEENHVPDDAQATTGHDAGQITLNASEADTVEREQMRTDLKESYRTLIGHFRHEIGHYYWDVLIYPDKEKLEAFRLLFGDERADYSESLEAHYEKEKNDEWTEAHVSHYAAAHPWEDWAETWAHYFHIIDSLETAYAFGLSLQPTKVEHANLVMQSDIDPYQHDNFSDILSRHVNLTVAINSINRSMGQPDLYPFILNSSVKDKLLFIHNTIKHQ